MGAIDFGPVKRDVKVVVYGEQKQYHATLDRLAVDDEGNIQILVVVAETQVVKGLNAAIQKTGSGISVSGCDLSRKEGGTLKVTSFGGLNLKRPMRRCAEGYTRLTERLSYGLSHAGWLSRSPEFIPDGSVEGVWRALNEPRYTTPIMRGWVGWISAQLVNKKLLVPTWGYRTKGAMLTATTADLDKIVSAGVRSGALRLDESAAELSKETA